MLGDDLRDLVDVVELFLVRAMGALDVAIEHLHMCPPSKRPCPWGTMPGQCQWNPRKDKPRD